MNYYVNENIKNTKRVFPMQDRKNFLRLDMNENPYGLPKPFIDEVLKLITPEFLATYPEPTNFEKAYAQYIGVNFENVLATNGSDMGIRYILETFCESESEVVTVCPSFEMYKVNCSLLGLKHVPVSYEKDFSISTNKIVEAIGDKTSAVVLLNPNNPIGNTYTDDEVYKIVYCAKKYGAIVIIDEAYHYFCSKTFMNLLKTENNVIILRTFSKLFSLAACRLGVMISNPEIISYVKNLKLTFDVNSIALLFGEAILNRPDIIEQLIASEREGKAYILSSLSEHGYNVRSCQGNFIFVQPKKDVETVVQKLKSEHKVLVKDFSNVLLKEYLRVTTGSVECMEQFLTAFYTADR